MPGYPTRKLLFGGPETRTKAETGGDVLLPTRPNVVSSDMAFCSQNGAEKVWVSRQLPHHCRISTATLPAGRLGVGCADDQVGDSRDVVVAPIEEFRSKDKRRTEWWGRELKMRLGCSRSLHVPWDGYSVEHAHNWAGGSGTRWRAERLFT
jgi:hypothetical protein